MLHSHKGNPFKVYFQSDILGKNMKLKNSRPLAAALKEKNEPFSNIYISILYQPQKYW